MALTRKQKQKAISLYCDGISQADIIKRLGCSRDEFRSFLRTTDEYKQMQRAKSSFKIEGAVLSSGYDSGGNYIQEKLVSLKSIERATPEELLELHGLDPTRWHIKTATNNFYEMQKKGGAVLPLYQSKIIAEPAKDQWAAILKYIDEHTTPYTVEPRQIEHGEQYLVVALNDTHFGSNSAEDYEESQQRIINLLLRGWTKVILYLGGDIFDANSGLSKTVHETRVSDYDPDYGWEQACRYIEPIIVEALKCSGNNAELVYLPGNHSEAYECGFAHTMDRTYTDLKTDIKSGEWIKARLLGKTLLGFSHGYKNQKNLPINLAKDFPELWGKSVHQECIAAHKHVESTDQGVLLRVMPTRADDHSRYVKENNYIRNHKAFMCLEYSEDDIRAIHYV